MSEHARQLAQKLRVDLQSPFSALEELSSVLAAPLYAFDLTSSNVYATFKPTHGDDDDWQRLDAQDKTYILKVYWAQFQEILATKIVIDWLDQLQKGDLHEDLWLPFFCPAPKTSRYAASIARTSLSTLFSILANKPVGAKLSSVAQKASPLPALVKDTSLDLLSRIVGSFNLTDYFKDIHSRSLRPEGAQLEWQAFLDGYFSLPARISNVLTDKEEIPQALEWRVFHIQLARQYEKLVFEVCQSSSSTLDINALSYPLGKMSRSGFMNSEIGRTTFWPAVFPQLRRRLLLKNAKPRLIETWQQIVASLSTPDYRTVASSCLAYLDHQIGGASSSRIIKQSAMMLRGLLGPAKLDDDRVWTTVIKGIFLSKPWNPSMARILSVWIGLDNKTSHQARAKLLRMTLEVWSEKEVIERAPVAYHTYLTSILLLTIRRLPALDKALVDMSRTPMFLTAITSHLSTMREEVRLQGMLVAEETSKKSLDPSGPVKSLNFGDIWQAEGASYDSIRKLKEWLSQAAGDSEVTDWEIDEADEGVVEEPEENGTAAPAASSRPSGSQSRPSASTSSAPSSAPKIGLIQVIDEISEFDDYDEVDEPDLQPYALPPKPAAEDLKDIEDLSAYTPAKKKPKPPVYIPDLLAYLKSDDANKLDMGLKEAASLIRRKAQWGTELSDAAIELAYILSGLQDNFSLDHFEARRREALTALMSCAPERAAPAVIEQFFTNQYSINQRTVMLASLAIGARELAGMPVPKSSIQDTAAGKETFPSQRLPGKLHDRFITSKKDAGDIGKELELLTEDITNIALARTRDSAEGTMPQAQKEKLLTVRSTRQKISTNGINPKKALEDVTFPAYNDLAVNTFIMPLLNRFWLYLRDVSTSPQDFRVGTFQGGSAGSVTLLEPMLLSKYLATLTILVESARNSPHFLAVLAPETLELVLAIRGINSDDPTVQTSMLQLALVVLDGSTSIDAGRTLAREHSKALWQLKDWAEGVWSKHEGETVGAQGRAAAGVLLRIDSVVQKTVGYV